MDLPTRTAIARATRVHHLAGDSRPQMIVDLNADATADDDAIALARLPELLQFHLNGEVDVSSQTARVQWLDDAARLRMPTALQANHVCDGPQDDARYLAHVLTLRDDNGSLPDADDVSAGFAGHRDDGLLYYDEDEVISHVEPDGAVVARPTATSMRYHTVEYNVAFSLGPGAAVGAPAVGGDAAPDAPPAVVSTFRFQRSEPDDVVCARIAIRFRLNLDPRDIHAFANENMAFADDACQDDVPLDRFRCRLRAFTVASTAALNLAAMGGHAVLAIARAHGVAAGLLPDGDTVHGAEHTFVAHRARAADFAACHRAMDGDAEAAFRASMSVHAMFGGLHLTANHTFRAGDNTLRRRGAAWLAGLRTVMPEAEHTGIQMAPELALRTCSHPFGLASTYSVLRWGATYQMIAEPIAIRATALPPGVQRLAMLCATTVKIAQLPIGRAIMRAYEGDIRQVRQALTAVTAHPTRYSPLSRMYGVPVTLTLDDATTAAMGRLAPMCAGFATAFFSGGGDGGRARGVGLAISLANISRDDEAMVNVWASAFTKYTEDVAESGIMSLLPGGAEVANAIEDAREH